MRVIVTRPAREAAQWVQALAARGVVAEALPLIAIAPVADARSLEQAWRDLDAYTAAMFVSANAVHPFFEVNRPAARMEWTSAAIKTRAWAPGPGTAAALAAAGVDAALIDAPSADAAQFDSDTLWQRVQQQVRAGDRVLVVRGADEEGQGAGRDWLAAQLRAKGATAEYVQAYRRLRPVFDAQQGTRALAAASDGSAWLFSSSQAIANLQALLPGQDWSEARAVATHPRIAQAARDAGFGVVCESLPAVDAIAAALESIG